VARYLYIVPALGRAGTTEHDGLAAITERQPIHLEPTQLREQPAAQAPTADIGEVDGVVLEPRTGILGRSELHAARRYLESGRRVWIYWPAEHAVEALDRERLQSYWRHCIAHAGFRAWNLIARPGRALRKVPAALAWAYRGFFKLDAAAELEWLNARYEIARPVPLVPAGGRGLYFRADYWNAITSGGSYGHTCYVAKELRDTSEDFVCQLAQRYALLDDLGVRQVVMERPRRDDDTEDAIIDATNHYRTILHAACQVFRPAYIYERLCLGNYAAALVSRQVGIPYIVEYNGSELSIHQSFDAGKRFKYRDVLLAAEALAFRQATCISVVSQLIKDDLVARGVDAGKIVVNPNGADVDTYAPCEVERARMRDELGFSDDDRVIGFTATFGGWHATDVLAAAMPRICAASPRNAFLIIGDGAHRGLVDEAIARHGLDGRVRLAGRVSQARGAQLLKACDLFVTPHNAHMVDSKFFGSPTKVFEYMSLGRGVVGSDLEQIGDVLSPALRLPDLRRETLVVDRERSILCTPGDVDEFTESVIRLADRPDIRAALGANARQAVIDHYSWKRHVEKLWAFIAGRRADEVAPLETGEHDKDELQCQWNNSPVGSDRARRTQPHSLEWFREIEADRYGVYAPWMPETMEFDRHAGRDVLEVGGGLGIDLAQFASHGARVTDLDLSAGHLALAQEHFRLRGLAGTFIHHDGESLPFPDASFDVVYSNGVIHHTPGTAKAVREMLRVLRPGGRAIVMVYAEDSLYYWRNLVFRRGVQEHQLRAHSMADILSRSVEASGTDARPLVKVYTRARLRRLFDGFADVRIVQRQLRPPEIPRVLRPLRRAIEPVAGWNLVLKARKAR
jgi:glycosyltransferase involved in cell wall biosynthesis/SAM-dependent methyltransferase